MPLLPVSEMERFSPLFRGKAGNLFAGFLRKVLSVETVSDLNDRFSHLDGAEFATSWVIRKGWPGFPTARSSPSATTRTEA